MRKFNLAPFYSPDDVAGTGVTGTQTATGSDQNVTGGQQSQGTQMTPGQQTQQSIFDPERHTTKEEASKAVKSRVDELNGKFKPYVEVVNRLMQKTGMTPEAIMQFVEGYGAQTQQHQVDPAVEQLRNTALTSAKVAFDTRRMVEEQELKSDANYADYEQVKDQVREYADQLGIPLKQAYWAVNGQTKVEAAKKEAAQRALEEARKRGGLGAESDSHAEFQQLGITPEQAAFYQAVGMDPKKAAALKRVNNLTDYRSLKAK